MGPVNRVIDETEASAFGYANPKAAAGNTEEGASAILSQGDLLSAIGASITVRSDTFVIRSYGAAREGTRSHRAGLVRGGHPTRAIVCRSSRCPGKSPVGSHRQWPRAHRPQPRQSPLRPAF